MLVSREWLQQYFDTPLPAAADIERLLGEHSFEPEGIEEVSGDWVLDFDVLPNRATDCLSHWGIAREIAVVIDKEIKNSPYDWQTKAEEHSIKPIVNIEDSEKCRRYMARRIDNIEVKDSPDWLKQRLTAIGQRSINNIVDATNYVMFDLGQPLHAFDGDLIDGAISVRMAEMDEEITTLDKRQVKLVADRDLVIADDSGILAIAGVKGGVKAEVTNKTTSIIIEAANFHPTSTRKTARGLGILTDSSKRFENSPHPELASVAIDLVTRLILEIASTDKSAYGPINDQYPLPVERIKINFSPGETRSLLGAEISDKDMSLILEKLSCQIDGTSDNWIVTPPWWRLDLNITQDLIEEIGRVYGYSNIPSVVPMADTPRPHKRFLVEQKIRNFLASRGFDELYTYTFTDSGVVHMANTIASDKGYLRSNLIEQVLLAVEKNAKNAPLFGKKDIRVFEIGNTFNKNDPVSEQWSLVVASDPLVKKMRAKGTVDQIQLLLEELLGELGLASVDINSYILQREDLVIEANLSAIVNDVEIDLGYTDLLKEDRVEDFASKRFSAFSLFPFMTRDIAVWVSTGIGDREIESLLQQHAGEWCQRIDLFDQFEKEGRVSYAFRLVFQAMDKTLSDEDVNPIMELITEECSNKGWEVR